MRCARLLVQQISEFEGSRKKLSDSLSANVWSAPLGRPRLRWVDNNRMDLQEVGCRYMEWIGLVQDRER